MTKEDAYKIIYVLRGAFPQYYKDMDKQKADIQAELWASVFEAYPAELVNAGVTAFMATDTSGFPPVPGQVMERIRDDKNELNAMEAWALVRKAICNGIYGAEEEFEKLPPLCQKAVGSPTNIREMAMMDVETVGSVEQSHFIRSYNAVAAREKELAKIPPAIRVMLDVTTERMIPG